MATTIIERPYKVYSGKSEYAWDHTVHKGVSWTYRHSFRTATDAHAYAERISEDYEFVKIEEKENN